MNILEIHDLSKKINTGVSNFMLLKNLNLSVKKGEFIAIMGKSGCGKSTLLSLISGIEPYQKGSIILKNKNVKSLSNDELAKFRSENIGFVFQNFNLINTLNISDNILVPLLLTPISRKERQHRVSAALQMINLADRKNEKPNSLSGGEQQRVAIARALVNDPAVILADEPTGSLDEVTTAEILNLFISCKKSGQSIILVTHDIDVALKADRIFIMESGSLRERSKHGSAI